MPVRTLGFFLVFLFLVHGGAFAQDVFYHIPFHTPGTLPMTPGGDWVVGPIGTVPWDASGTLGGHAAWISTGAPGPVARFVEVEIVVNDGLETRASTTYFDVPFTGQTATTLGWLTKSVGFSTGNSGMTGSARIRFRGVLYTGALGTVAIDHVRLRPLSGGQANSAVAALTVRGNAADGVPGPFLTAINKGEPIEFSFRGGAYVPFVFMAGPLAATPTPLSCAGTVDIGTPPFYDVIIIGNGLNFGLESLIFTLDGNGRANVTFSSWPLPVGTIFAVQAFIYPSFGGNCFGYLTAAHEIHIE